MAANQTTLAELENNEAALRQAWASVPGTRQRDFARKVKQPAIKRCLARIAEAQMTRGKRHGHTN